MFCSILPLLEAKEKVSPLLGVEETSIPHFDYLPYTPNENIGLKNIFIKPHELVLRASFNKSSMLRFEKEVPEKEWSFEFTINELGLGPSQTAGIYLYYTDEEMDTGPYKGAESVFNGFMVGVEFTGKSVNLVHAKNEGKNLYHSSITNTKIDSINPERFRNVTELKVKVINTEKNFKVELYENDRVVYDLFKNLNTTELRKHGKYLSLFTQYTNVPSEKAFVLKSAKLNKRVEKEFYDPYRSHASEVPALPLSKEEIQHHDNDVKNSISGFMGLETYLKSVIGNIPHTNLEDIKETATLQIEEIVELYKKIEESRLASKSTNSSASRINTFAVKIKQLQQNINMLSVSIDGLIENQKEQNNHLSLIILAAGLGSIAFLVIREFNTASSDKKTQ